MDNRLLIVGAGGHGRVVGEIATSMEFFSRINFLDDNSDIAIGECSDYKKLTADYNYAFVAFGKNELRKNWLGKLTEVGYQIPVLIDPTAYVSPSASIANGSIICAKSVINTRVRIENGCIISIGALIDHDSVVGEYSHINTGSIIRANSNVERLIKLNAGMIYGEEFTIKENSYELRFK
ncbi:hypothetical protein [Metabacillus litoralis]|uniref:PglD-related sugar-binding protein n=1 Tax=Metabacillus litoralis TaxID=152268 RepID=UPI001CFCBBC8|nr:hypothetical protein [Metabacillus litoralis]